MQANKYGVIWLYAHEQEVGVTGDHGTARCGSRNVATVQYPIQSTPCPFKAETSLIYIYAHYILQSVYLFYPVASQPHSTSGIRAAETCAQLPNKRRSGVNCMTSYISILTSPIVVQPPKPAGRFEHRVNDGADGELRPM